MFPLCNLNLHSIHLQKLKQNMSLGMRESDFQGLTEENLDLIWSLFSILGRSNYRA